MDLQDTQDKILEYRVQGLSTRKWDTLTEASKKKTKNREIKPCIERNAITPQKKVMMASCIPR